MNSQRTKSIDGFKPRQSNTTVRQRVIANNPPIRRTQRTHAQPQSAPKQNHGFPEWLQMPLIIGGAMLAGVFAQNALLGQLTVLAYGAAALIFGIASRVSFTLALLTMCATILLLVFKGDVAMSQNFAIYTFLLLVVGVITLNRELKREGGRIYSIKKNT